MAAPYGVALVTFPADAVTVAYSNSEGISGIIRLGDTAKTEYLPCHFHDLLLLSLTVASDGGLYLQWSVLENGDTSDCRSKESNSPCLRHIYAGFLVIGEVELFHGNTVRLEFYEKLLHIKVYHFKPLGEWCISLGSYSAIGKRAEVYAIVVQHAEANYGIARIYAENSYFFHISDLTFPDFRAQECAG